MDLSLIKVDSSDPSVTYSAGWQDMRDIEKMTLQRGANATVNFSGEFLAFMRQKLLRNWAYNRYRDFT